MRRRRSWMEWRAGGTAGDPPPFGDAFFWDWGPNFSGPHPLGLDGCDFFFLRFHLVVLLFCCFVVFEEGQKTKTLKLAKVGLAKVGHPNFGQSMSIKVGPSGQTRRRGVRGGRNSYFYPCRC